MRVAQSHRVWLPQTETWLHTQLRFLPAEIEAHVVCQQTRNLDQFAFPHIHAQGSVSRARVLWDAYGRRLLGRAYPAHVLRATRTIRAELLHSHFGPIGWADLGVARRLGIPPCRHVLWCGRQPGPGGAPEVAAPLPGTLRGRRSDPVRRPAYGGGGRGVGLPR
jgi:hypothetical protein